MKNQKLTLFFILTSFAFLLGLSFFTLSAKAISYDAGGWRCQDWGECLAGSQTRSCSMVPGAMEITRPPASTQTCAMPVCDVANGYTCNNWNSCSSSGSQTRVCSLKPECEGIRVMPVETIQTCLYCNVADAYDCTAWPTCSVSGSQTRSCTVKSGCVATDLSSNPPQITQACACIADEFSCTEWSACSTSGLRTRGCTLSADCSAVTTTTPAERESCTPDPVIYSASPSVIHEGDTVYLAGHSFWMASPRRFSCPSPQCKVIFNGVELATDQRSFGSNTLVSFRVPLGATSGLVKVTNYLGTESNSFPIEVTPNALALVPDISSLAPYAITPGDTIIVHGTNFGAVQGSSQLLIDGLPATGTILSWSDTAINYRTSTTNDIKSRRVSFRKCSTATTCLADVPGPFFYIQPTITSISPLQGGVGAEIRISGRYFKSENIRGLNSTKYVITVWFNNIQANITSWENDYLYVNVPAGATDGPIMVKLEADNLTDFVYHTGSYFDVLDAISRDTYSGSQLYLKQIHLPQAWGIQGARREITVAIIDDGINNSHPDLQDNLWRNTDEIPNNLIDDDHNGYIDDVNGWDFISGSSDVRPYGGHGTAVAGIIGAIADNNLGIAGINQNVKLLPLLICNKTGCLSSKLNEAIKYAVDNGAEVINISLGSTGVVGYTATVDEGIKYAYVHNVLVVAAAGNGNEQSVYSEGWNLDVHPQSPVCNDGGDNMVIGVGAVDNNNIRTSWSNYGTCVDVNAPGIDILSTTIPELTFNDQLKAIDTTGYYAKANGTSFAAPIVTGVVSLLKASYPSLTSAEAGKMLITTANGGVLDAFALLSAKYIPTPKATVTIPLPVPVTSTISADGLISTPSIPISSPTTSTTPPASNTDSTAKSSVSSDINTKAVTTEEKALIDYVDSVLSSRLKGKILLQVEKNGEGWYVNPLDKKKYFLGRPADAFSIMRNLGLGISETNYQKFNNTASANLRGRILLRVEAKGEAYYVHPETAKMFYLGRPADAFKVMRELGLGITNADIRKIDVGEVVQK